MMSKIKFFRAAAFVTAAVMGFGSAASAAYYSPRELPSVDAESLVYSEFSPNRMRDTLFWIEWLSEQRGTGTRIASLADRCREEYLTALEAYRLAKLENDRNYNEETSLAASEAYSDSLTAFEIFSRMIRHLASRSEYSYIARELLGANDMTEFVSTLPSMTYYDLAEREEELMAQYGQTADQNEAAELFCELVEVRTAIAKDAGYDSYADYAHEELYHRDYSREMIDEFSNAAAENFSGMFDDIFNATMVVRGGGSTGRTESEAMDAVGSVMSEISPELGDTFEYMTENGLYDVSYSETKNKVAGAYTVMLPSLGVPFMLVNPSTQYENGASDAARNIIHEFGHFSALLNDPALDDRSIELIGDFAMDTCEVQAQGLEVLSDSYYGRLFGSGASLERYLRLLKCVGAILDGCMFNEFQTRVYDMGSVTVAEANEIMVGLLNKYYGLDHSAVTAQGLWTSMVHNFEAPMYYLSYAVSGAAALQLLSASQTDTEAVDTYMKISALGGYVPFKQALEQAGFEDVFDAEVIKKTAAAVRAEYAIGYEDVDSSAWYEPFVLGVSHIMDGADETRFAPDEDIERGDFLELIARGHDYYTGIEGGDGYAPGHDGGSGERFISWTEDTGITNGYGGGETGYGDDITREQLVVMLYRLCLNEHSDIGPGEDTMLSQFPDAGSVSDWAHDAMVWAVSNGMIGGRDDGTIDPQGSATRAEAAKIETEFILTFYDRE